MGLKDPSLESTTCRRHVVGKQHTITIEQDNGNTRHNLARMARSQSKLRNDKFDEYEVMV
jgi:IS1 family transposase